MAILCILRVGITAALVAVGTSYILKTNVYTDLLMNGVTLFFVAEVASVLYNQVLREEIRDQCEDIKPMKVAMFGLEWLNRRPALLDMACVIFLFGVVYVVLEWQMTTTVLPVYDSLECSCTSSGAKCVEANKFNKPFWDTYWMKTVPDVFKEIDKLKAGTPAAMLTAVAAAQADRSTADAMASYASTRELESRVNHLHLENLRLQTQVRTMEKLTAEKLAATSATTHQVQYELGLHSIGGS